MKTKETKKEVKVDYLARIIDFFKDDSEVKRLLLDAAPKEEYAFRPEQYAKMLENSIEYIKYHISKMLNTFFPQGLKDSEKFFKDIEYKLASCGTDYYDLSHFYRESFSNMRPELVEEVGTHCIGYYMFSGVSLRKATSVDELLHIVHQTIVNNEFLYSKMPKIAEMEFNDENKVTLYGEETELARNIFNAYPEDIKLGLADILSFNGQFIIMVRNRGHALSIEITPKKENEYYVNYFIPKICNVNMVNELKGVRKVDENSEYTRGVFMTTADELPFELIDFISKVPTDDDMFKEGGKSYRS